jgi:hypothetical protein
MKSYYAERISDAEVQGMVGDLPGKDIYDIEGLNIYPKNDEVDEVIYQ